MGVLATIPAVCSGFLLAVLWMDLLFDTQALAGARRREQLDEAALASIAGYYHRATTTSQPMGRLLAVVMALLVGSVIVHAARGATPGWVLAGSAVAAGGPILLAMLRTVPNAVRLGWRGGSAAEQTRLARAILADHVACAVGMLTFVVLWLGWAG